MNLLSLLAGLTKRDPHAIIAIDVDPEHPQHVSRAELWRRTLQLRADLATAGVGRGDTVLVCLPAWSSALDWHIATASLGAHVVAVDPAPAEGAGVAGEDGGGADGVVDDIVTVFERTRPKVAAAAHGVRPRTTSAGSASSASPVTLPTTLREAVARTGGAAPSVAVVAGPHDTPPVDPSPYDIGAGAWLPSAATAGMPMPDVGGDELAVAFAPTLAAHRESAVVAHATATAAALGLGEDDVVVCARPLSDVAGFTLAFTAVAGGATYVLDPAPAARGLLDDMARFGATHLAADADTVLRMVDAWRSTAPPAPSPAGAAPPAARRAPSWRWLGLLDGTGRSSEAARRAEAVFGVRATGVYGSADLLRPTTLWPPEATATDRAIPGGRPVSPSIEIRVVDPVSGRPVPPGEQGEVQVRGPNVVDAYLGAADAVAHRRTEDGWWPTGDTGSLSADGELRHHGRIAAGTSH